MYKKILMVLLLVASMYSLCSCTSSVNMADNEPFTVLSSNENENLEPLLMEFASKNKIDLKFVYTGSLNIPYMVQANQRSYDAVWSSNSIWNASISSSVLKNSKSISVNPVIFAVKKSKYDGLSFSRDTVVSDLVSAVEAGHLKFLMPSVTQTNSGASAYIGFLNCLAGNPPVLTEEDLNSEALHDSLKKLFKGVARNSGNDEYLIDIFNSGDYDALVNYESSLIELNNRLIKDNKEPLMFIYPSDGVSVSDSPFAYVDNNNENKLKNFKLLQDFLLSKDTQKKLESMGRRTSYGGLVENEEVFKESYGIDKNSYISPIKYPAGDVIKKSLALYQDMFRKPSAVVFCLDYSGSMYGVGNRQLLAAMEKILNVNEASNDLIQFAQHDEIFVIPFEAGPIWVDSPESGTDTESLISKIKNTEVNGGTDIYKPVELARDILADFDSDTYTKSIVLMTDGESNGRFEKREFNIPVFSIMFGDANPEQLDEISRLTNGRTFDGRTDLINAFKEIRAYN